MFQFGKKFSTSRALLNNFRSFASCVQQRAHGEVLRVQRKWNHPVVRRGRDFNVCSLSFASLHQSAIRAATVPFKLADIGEGIKEVTIKEWFVKEGDRISQFDQLCEVQSDKASVTITSRYDGIIRKIHHDVDAIAQVGDTLVDIEAVGGDVASGTEAPKVEIKATDTVTNEVVISAMPSSSSSSSVREFVRTLATPAVRRIATEYKVKLNDIQGTGKDGRVLKEDILKYVGAKQLPSSTEEYLSAVKATVSGASGGVPQDRVETMKGYTRAMVKTMTQANEIPHFGYFDEVNVTPLVELRERLKERLRSQGIKLSFMPFFIKAASVALSQYPVLNSTIDPTAGTVTYKGAHNIGVAMDTKLGLIVPTIKNVQNLSIVDIAVELNRLHECGLRGSVKSEDLDGTTFTLSNIGAIGGTYAVPVIKPPQVAIGAVGMIQVLPRFDSEGNVVRASVLQVSWSADHRIIDGATMSRFSNAWKSYLEEPATLLLHLK